MFKNTFQDGPYVEVFSAQSKSLEGCKVTGTYTKVFDQDVKSFVYQLKGSNTSTKMLLPTDSKSTLGLTQHFLVFQMYITIEEFSIELGVTDDKGSRVGVNFSSICKEIKIDPLHARIPCDVMKRGQWLNLCFDLNSIVLGLWKGRKCKSLDSLCVSGNSKLRRVFTMRQEPYDTTDDIDEYGSTWLSHAEARCEIPRPMAISSGITQLINWAKLLLHQGQAKGIKDVLAARDIDSADSKKVAQLSGTYHIAFGSKVAVNQKKVHKSGRSVRKEPAASNTSQQQTSGWQNQNLSDPTELRLQKNVEQSLHSGFTSNPVQYNGSDSMIITRHPHPPKNTPPDGSRRRPHRVRPGKDQGVSHYSSSQQDSSSSRVSSAESWASAGRSDQKHHNLINKQPDLVTSHRPVSPEVCKVASESEELDIMTQVCRTRGHQDNTDSESDVTSQDTSGGLYEDSLQEILRKHQKASDSVESVPDTDDSDRVSSGQVYTYTSFPQNAPRTRRHEQPVQQKKVVRRKRAPALGSSIVIEGIGQSERKQVTFEGSTDEDEKDSRSLMNKQRSLMNKQRSPRSRKHREVSGTAPISYSVPLKVITDGFPVPTSSLTPDNSQTRTSISRRALREIPHSEIGRSGGDKPYDPAQYKIKDLSDSEEAAMLAGLQLEEDVVSVRSQGQRQGHVNTMLEYQTDSSDEMSTLRNTVKSNGDPHDYQEEMNMMTIKSLNNDYLTQSNTSELDTTFNASLPSPEDEPIKPQRQYSHNSSDREDDLDLLYDPVLKYFYDPKTGKYYELITS